MKTIKILTLTILLLLVTNIANAQSFCGGDGTEPNPYQICTIDQLASLAEFVNDGKGDLTAGVYFKLMNNLDMNDWSTISATGWIPIGNNSTGTITTHFQGNFDGNGKVVKNLMINKSSPGWYGLFGFIEGANIQNLGLENVDLNGSNYVGSLIGYSKSSNVSNCYATGSVKSSDSAGGLVGSNSSNSTITNSYSTCSVNGNGSMVGGLAGSNVANSTIANCYATGEVNGNYSGVGGLHIGGFVGYNYNATITNCYATGAVTGSASGSIITGGLVGWNGNSTIKNCVAANNSVSGTSGNSDIHVNRISGADDSNGTLENNYANEAMTVLLNGSSAPLGTTGLTTEAGEDKTLTELKIQSFYTSSALWNFTTIWGIYEGYGFPYLRSFNNDIIIVPTGGSKDYDATPAPTPIAYSVVSDNPLVDLTLPFTGVLAYSGIDPTFTNAGTYAIIQNTLTNKSYQVSFKDDESYIISAVSITVTALGGSSYYGESPANPGLSADGLAPGETVAVLTGLSNSFGISSATEVGNYTLEVIGALSNGNYTITEIYDGQWTVNPAIITVTAIGGSSNFGESPINPGLSFSGLHSDFDESLLADLYNNFSITSDTPAGTYTLNVKGDFSALSYTIARNSGVWVVNQLPGYFENLPILRVVYTPTLTLADVILPEGYKWNSPATSLKPGNNQIFAATYTDPSGNYTTVIGTLQVNVRKAEGAEVSGPPTLNGLATVSSIAVNILTIPDNPGNQTVEYAISTNGALLDAPTPASLDGLSWQSGTIFTGVFSENTNYYVYARSATNTYYSTGPAQVSAAIKVGDFTGLVETGRAPSQLAAWINDGVLYVSGLTPGKPWGIYNILGTLIYQGIATDVVETGRAPSLRIGRGIYIILSEGETVKIKN